MPEHEYDPEDRLDGAREIARYVGEPVRSIYYQLEKGLIPAGKHGSKWMASKRVLTDHYKRVTSGERVAQK